MKKEKVKKIPIVGVWDTKTDKIIWASEEIKKKFLRKKDNKSK